MEPLPDDAAVDVTMLTGLLPPEHGVRNNVGFAFDRARTGRSRACWRHRCNATGARGHAYVLRARRGSPACSTSPRTRSTRARHGLHRPAAPGGVTLGFAKRWLDAHAAGPFLYFFHVYEPHVPWDPPEPFRGRYPHPYDGEVAAADAVVGGLLEHLRQIGVYDRAIVIVTSDHGEGLGDHGEEQHSILLYREAIQVPLLLKLPGNLRRGSA